MEFPIYVIVGYTESVYIVFFSCSAHSMYCTVGYSLLNRKVDNIFSPLVTGIVLLDNVSSEMVSLNGPC
jgi:hypothetical protein